MSPKLPLTLILAALFVPLSVVAQNPTVPRTSANLLDNPTASPLLTGSSSRPTVTYPWKLGISATMFYIGEGPSAWNLPETNNDPSTYRSGYASGSHASLLNPFYIALPFNDLVYPDKAQQYVPAAWHREPKDGKPVSACQHRWVEIKMEDGTGHVCYAQWEDVGPSRDDHAEYVFGPERPDTGNRAGIDVSPAVASYLGFADMKGPIRVRWRFVEPEDVPPGVWLKLEEQSILYKAMHESKP
jgi:hypothetical protein